MKKKNLYKLILIIAVVLVFSISLYQGIETGIIPSGTAASKEELPVVGTLDNFKKLVEESQKLGGGVYRGLAVDDMKTAAVAENSSQKAAAGTSSSSADYSKTNIQVEGVDESDVVKTDGKYIYQVNNRKIVIAKAYPASEMKLAKTIEFADKNFNPMELYVDGSYLTVIGSSFVPVKPQEPVIQDSANNKKVGILPRYPIQNGTVKVFVYDIKDRENPQEIRQVEMEGSLVSSRKIGSKLYLVSNKFLQYYLLENGSDGITPMYRDSVSSSEFKSIGFDNIKYFPDAIYDNYMIIGAMDVSNKTEIAVQTYLGAGQNIYVSTENLYAAVNKYDKAQPKEQNAGSGDKIAILPMPVQNANTLVYKFALNKGNVTFAAKGEVPGTILNQFSMDEHDKYFRIATTSGNAWDKGENQSKNNIYILDSNMGIAGKVEDIAPGEKIYSVRFMGDRGYLVTFETVDPLFVVDLKDPRAPKILGELKIPGYSNYLEPYDESHIIGFGKDAIVLPMKDGKGNVVGEQAYYMGMKIAIFDATDVNNPKEMSSVTIGDRGTDSELLYNHKALLFSKEKNLLAFPVNLCELKPGQSKINSQYNYPEYGSPVYQGAYVYNIDLKKGFTLLGRITHKSDTELKDMQRQYNWLNNVERILYINDTLYTASKGKIMASDMKNLNKTGEITIPQDTNY